MSERTNTKVHSLYFYLARVKFLCFMYYCGGSVFCENDSSECWGNTEEEKKKMFRRNRKGNVEKGESHCSDYSHSQLNRGIFRHANSYKMKNSVCDQLILMVFQYLNESDYESKKQQEIATLEQTILLQKKVLQLCVYVSVW